MLNYSLKNPLNMMKKHISSVSLFVLLLLTLSSCHTSYFTYRSSTNTSGGSSVSTAPSRGSTSGKSTSTKPSTSTSRSSSESRSTSTSTSGTTTSRKKTTSGSKTQRLRSDIASLAKKQVGTKYKYGGRDPKGFDCSGFTHYVLGNFDISLPTNSGMQSQKGKKVKLKETQSGDLIFFKRSGANNVFHVAMVLSNDGDDDLRIIHSTSSRGVVIDNLYQSSYWRPKIYTARTVIEP